MIFADILLGDVAKWIGYLVMTGIGMFIIVSVVKSVWNSFKKEDKTS